MGRTVTSDDGLLTLDIPDGAASPDLAIAATAKGKADLPPELAGIKVRSAFYDLQPDGTQFSAPVAVHRTISLSALGIDPTTQGYPIIRLANRTTDGTWAWLDDQELTVMQGGTEEESATLTHFSDLFGFGGTDYLRVLTQPPSELTVNQPYQIKLLFDYTDGLPAAKRPSVDSTTGYVNAPGIDFSTPQVGAAGPNDQPFSYTVTCRTPGTFQVGANITFKNLGAEPLLSLDASAAELYLRFSVYCRAQPPAPLVYLLDGCLSVTHTQLGNYPSFLHWDLSFSFDRKFDLTNPTLSGTFDEDGLMQKFSMIPIVVDPSGEGTASFNTGITKYGGKHFDELIVNGSDESVVDVTQALVDLFGPSVIVTAKPGTLAGDSCTK